MSDFIEVLVGRHYYIKHTHPDGKFWIEKYAHPENNLENLAFVVADKNGMYNALGSKIIAIVLCEVTDIVTEIV